MAELVDFARYARPELPMCPEMQILDAIRRAGIEFCKRSKIMQEVVTLNTVANTPSYDLTTLMMAGTEPDDVLDVTREGKPLSVFSQYDTFKHELSAETGSPNRYYLDGRKLHLVVTPDSIETLTVTVKARPSESAVTLPDELYRRYSAEIAAGAKSFLMLQSKQPWTNLEQAAVYKMVFDKTIDTENLRYAKGGGSKPLRSSMHSF